MRARKKMIAYASTADSANDTNVTTTATVTASGTVGSADSSEMSSGTSAISIGGAAEAATPSIGGAASATPLLMMNASENHDKQLDVLKDLDCDCDSLSDGREKADTTPENVRKIDDVIASSACANDAVIDRTAGDGLIGLAVAIGESNAKFCHANSLGWQQLHGMNHHHYQQQQQQQQQQCQYQHQSNQPHLSPHQHQLRERDSQGKSEFIESSTNSPTTTTTTTAAGAIPAPMKASLVGSGAVDYNNDNSYFGNSHHYNNKMNRENNNNDNNNGHGHQFSRSDDGGDDLSTSNTPAAAAATAAMESSTAAGSQDKTAAISADAGGGDAATESKQDAISKAECEKERQSYAFTIDNFGAGESDPATTAAKYKSMMERFQNRHRRGASMSKLESESVKTATIAAGTPTSSTHSSYSASLSMRNARNAERPQQQQQQQFANIGKVDGFDVKVKLRPRDRSTSHVRDASKRHSWSPRSNTTHEAATNAAASSVAQTPTDNGTSKRGGAAKAKRNAPIASTATTPTSATISREPLKTPKGTANALANRTAQPFTPRSTAMQLALQEVDFIVNFKELRLEVEDDNISETGTYTLDGDNYTEEQKELMNIDRSAREREARRQEELREQQQQQQQQRQHRPRDLKLPGDSVPASAEPTKIPRPSNVLEVNYYHDTGEPEPRTTPRTKKPTIQATDNLIAGANPDLGCFTSVTTSGVLAKQSALHPRPKLTRRSSLSTSQIDSSEYVSNESKLKNGTSAAYAAGGFTDHQKAEYRLNVFTNQNDSRHAHERSYERSHDRRSHGRGHGGRDLQKFAATRQLIESPPDTPTSKHSDTGIGALKTAQTKNDWIQEWARNARARSFAQQPSGDDTHTDDDSWQLTAATLTKSMAEHYRLAVDGGEYASSDPALSTHSAALGACKPPKSPSKIPSPLHSLGRVRSASRTRASLQNMLQSDNALDALDDDDGDGDGDAAVAKASVEADDIYLQDTAAAINSLQQSLSRKNSLQSPTHHHSASPRVYNCRAQPPLYSPLHHRSDGYGGVRGGGYAPPPPLMTSSINEQQLQLLTSGEYLRSRQMRARINSFDGNIDGDSPARRSINAGQATHNGNNNKNNNNNNASRNNVGGGGGVSDQSPLRRSSSFSAKIATQRAARPQFQNLYTPPAARHNYVTPNHANAHTHTNAHTHANAQHGGGGRPSYAYAQLPIKKSASSNNFGGHDLYSDYNEHLQYYINDEDDEEDDLEYYSSGDEGGTFYRDNDNDNDDDVTTAPAASTGGGGGVAMPLSNMRYNKALLMRIERTKQKVAAAAHTKQLLAPPPPPSSARASSACPNTPELPRRGGIRGNMTRGTVGGVGVARQSMPRDTSLSRLATQVPSSLASAKKQLLQTAAAVPASPKYCHQQQQQQRVQPKYLDISKYKPAQGNSFLRKNDAKSTLMKLPAGADAMKRSPSSSSMGLSRADPTRTSNRSVRSMASGMTTSVGSSVGSTRASSAARRDASAAKQKEAEMAMWKRRSTYDPMRAAAEDRRKKEEAKRLSVLKHPDEGEIAFQSGSSCGRMYSQQESINEQQEEHDHDQEPEYDDDEHGAGAGSDDVYGSRN